MSAIRPYRDDDFRSLVSLWNRCLPYESLTAAAFRRRVLLDRNLEPGGLLLAADTTGAAAGFVLSLVLRVPIEKTGLLEHRGFITAFGVLPEVRRQGIGTRLFDAAESFLRERGRTEVAVAPYPSGYFVPGIDEARYSPAVSFLGNRGYTEFAQALAMDAVIAGTDYRSLVAKEEAGLREEGIVVEPLTAERTAGFLGFLAREMPGDWIEDARRHLEAMTLGHVPEDSVFVARDGDAIIGYCKFAGEHFGPFGVAPAYQGRGIGQVLLGRTLEQMRREGLHCAYVLWTGERAARGIYRRLGFSVTRRFRLMRRDL